MVTSEVSTESTKGSGAIGSAPVSKTGGCGFESLLPCSGRRPHDKAYQSVVQTPTTKGMTVSGSARAAASGAEGTGRSGPRPAGGNQPTRRGLFARVAVFVRQVVAELKKVVNPTRQELFRYTSVVLVFVGVIMAFITVVDLGAGSLVGWVFG